MSGSLFDLNGQVAIVTGASRGLGEEMAEGLAEAGAAVMLVARREQWLIPALENLRSRGARCSSAICDISKPDEIARTVARAVEEFGRLDILVNNAGVTWGAPAGEMPLDRWRAVLDVNLTGAFLFAQAASRVMIPRQSGCIVNVASIAGLRAMPEFLPTAGYVASKGGLIALTRQLAVEWAPHGIRVNAIAPGFFPSRMSDRALQEHQPEIERRIPMRRIGRPGELKGVAVFLASAAAQYITGQTIAVDGGTTAA